MWRTMWPKVRCDGNCVPRAFQQMVGDSRALIRSANSLSLISRLGYAKQLHHTQIFGFTLTILKVPTSASSTVEINALAGQTLYVLGPNGSGKSTLLYSWARANPSWHLIAGNREIIFESSAVSLSAAQAKNEAQYAIGGISQDNARHSRNYNNNSNWLQRLIFLIKSGDDYYAGEYMNADRQNKHAHKEFLYDSTPTKRINAALRAANLSLSLSWSRESDLRVHKDGVDLLYGADAMSDGERSALIIAGQAVLAEPDSTILVDEPERHLHRSISSPLINHLKELRGDLTWIIATHDLSLPQEDPSAQVAVLYDFSGTYWNIDVVTDTWSLEPTLAEAVYGARQKVLFVEGTATSLDLPLLKIFYNGVTIVPTGNCRDVENATMALGQVAGVHRMTAKGLIDSDNRVDHERLQKLGVSLLGVYAIESIYYHPLMVSAVHASAGTKVSLDDIYDAAVGAISDETVHRVAKDAAYKAFSYEYRSSMPSINDFMTDDLIAAPTKSAKQLFAEKSDHFRSLLNSKNWEEIIKYFKIKSTSAPQEIARRLGFLNAGAYEIAARKMLKARPEIRDQLRTLLPDPFEVSPTHSS